MSGGHNLPCRSVQSPGGQGRKMFSWRTLVCPPYFDQQWKLIYLLGWIRTTKMWKLRAQLRFGMAGDSKLLLSLTIGLWHQRYVSLMMVGRVDRKKRIQIGEYKLKRPQPGQNSFLYMLHLFMSQKAPNKPQREIFTRPVGKQGRC